LNKFTREERLQAAQKSWDRFRVLFFVQKSGVNAPEASGAPNDLTVTNSCGATRAIARDGRCKPLISIGGFQRRSRSGAQDMVAYQNQARWAEAQYIADRRQREQQRTRDSEASRQRQREQNFWAEHAAYVKRVTTPPKISKPEPRILVPSHAATVFVPDASEKDAGGKEPARCFSASVEDFFARMLGFAITGTMWAYAAIVVVPWLYASAFNHALVDLGVAFGLSVNLAVWIICGIEFLVLCRVAKWIATRTAACMAWLLVLPVAFLEAGFDALFRKKS
jgi:hypothetical protein